jgi:uncharacterized membrane protein
VTGSCQTALVDADRRLVLLVALAASSLLTIALGVTDAGGTPYYPTRFLAWNLGLAWIPLLCALMMRSARRLVTRGLFGALWLIFLPNAPYLVTDLVHLRRGSGLWRHVLQFGYASWTGVILGVVSLRIVHLEVERRAGRAAGWVCVAASVALCAVGVVIGRFQRWNSWDLLTRPTEVASTTWNWASSPFDHVQSTSVAVAVALFFGLAYLTAWSLEGLSSSRR